MIYDAAAAADYADRSAEPHSRGRCAEYVRKAIKGGGITMAHTHWAKDYGPVLKLAGFYEVIGGLPKKGDVVVIQPAPGHPAGHMAIYDGTRWVSDFKQLHGLYPGPAYRSAQPSYTIYRHSHN